MKKQLLVVTAILSHLTFDGYAASVGADGYSTDFSTQPAVTDWATYSISGSSTTSSSSNDLNTAAQAATASTINAALTTEAASPVTQLGTAVWSSSGQSVQTRPTGNNGTLLMLTLRNDSGSDAAQITVSYDYSEAGTTFAEQIPGHLVYYSLSGAANSWIPIPNLCSVPFGRLSATVGFNWPAGATLYLLWADDNADGGTDAANVLDNFSVTLASAVKVPATITQSPTNLTVNELSPAVFGVTAAGNPAPTYQWYRNQEAIPGATDSTYTIAETPLAYDQSQIAVVVMNTISNVNYAATSAVAVLTVRADTNGPTLVDAYAVGSSQVLVSFSEPILPATATNASNYYLTNASGLRPVVSAVQDATLTNVVLTVSALTQGAQYTVVVNGVADRSAATNAIAPNSSRTFIAYSYVPANVGSPAVAGSAVAVSGGFDITGGGTSIGGGSDQFMFYYQQKSGDFDVKVRVAGLSLSDAWAKAGLMARETLNANSPFAAAFATPTISGAFGQYRAAAGGTATMTASYPVNYPHTWLRLKRAGNAFAMYAGLNGTTWYEMGTATITMGNTIYLGFSVCASATNTAALAQFRDYGDSTGAAVAPLKLTREPLGPSSRRGGLVITEIMFNPRELAGTNNSLEFVEIFNSNPFFEDISGFRLTGSIDYTFPPNTILRAGEFAVIARYPEAVKAYYGLTNVFGPFESGLPNDAGRVRLRHKNGGVLQEVNYDTRPPWPAAADGTGHSLVLARPSYGEGDPTAWEASTYVDGSPGRQDPVVADPMSAVVINEFLANSEPPQEDFIELYNYSAMPVDISGAWLTDKRGIITDPTVTNKFRIPDGTVLPARGFKVYYQSELNFALGARGETILLVNSNLDRVVDILPFEGQQVGVSSGRYPDGSPSFHALQSQTPGTNNAALRIHDIVINEIMYNPPAAIGEAGEYVELYNKGTNVVDLSRWRFTAGIDYRFPLGTTLAPGGYLVVAKNVTNLLASYTNLSPANTLGNYGGSLANAGERLALAMPEYYLSTNDSGLVVTNVAYLTVDEVTYRDGGQWGTWSDRGGSSLELIDPRSDNRLAANWADSDETLKAPWTNVVWTELADHIYPRGAPGANLDEFQAMILGQGEVLMDDVEVRAGTTGANLVANGNFASGLAGWLIQGNHVNSTVELPGPGNPSQSLRIRASAGGDNGANRVEANLTSALSPNTVNTIAAKLRWLRGHPDVLLRLHGGGIEASVTLPIPKNLGTPGAPNSRLVANAGPAIWDVAHTPVLPAGGATVTVTARVHDPDGIANVQVRYRIDPSSSYSTLAMVDNGTGADAVAGDGIFSAALPAQNAGTLVAFHVQATDANPTAASRNFPAAAPTSECLVRYGDISFPGNFGVYRVWMTSSRYNTWTTRERLSNEPMECTFVYNNYRAIYLAGARYRGSPFTRNPSSPTATGANFVWTLPADDLFLGSDELNLDSLEPTGRDATALRELTSFTMAEQLGLPFSYQRFIHPVYNGVAAGSPIYTDTQQPNGDYVTMWFPDGDNGELYKVDDWFEFDDTPAMQANKCASLQVFTTTGGVFKKARYRWNWEKKFNGGLDDDYTSIFEAAAALNGSDPLTYPSQVESVIDAEQWLTVMALGHVVGDWDRYGYSRGKNTFVYRPRGKPFAMLLWDLDFSLGCSGGHGPTQDLFSLSQDGDTGQNHMPEVAKFWSNPYFRRIYYRALRRIAEGPLQDAAYAAKLNARFQALVANGLQVGSSGSSTTIVSPYAASGAQGISIPAWIQQRRNYILGGANNAHPALAVSAFTVTNAASIVSSNNQLTLGGTAPVTVKSIRVNGRLYPVTWGANYTTWNVTLAPTDNDNTLVIQACDYQDQPIAGLAVTNRFTYTGTIAQAPGTVVFSEIMHHPVATNAEYVEIYNSSPDFTFDLSNWRVNGLDFTFPFGAFIGPRKSLVLVKDRTAFTTAYGATAATAIAGVFPGVLDKDGETLTLLMPLGNGSGEEVVVDRVRFETNAPWPASAANIGAALQLIDHRQDNGRIVNWSDGAGWRQVVFSVTNLITNAISVQIRVKSAGDIYLDDLRVETGTVVGEGTNLIVNGDFESPLDNGWLLGTNVLASTLSTDIKHSGNSALHLIASARANTIPAGLSQLPLPLVKSQVYTVSFWFLPSATLTNIDMYCGYSVYQNNIPTLDDAYNSSPGATNSVTRVLPALPALWLNEVQPQNLNGPTDNFGEQDPWVEIYNSGTNAVSLDGWYLTDNYTNLAQWPFPAGTAINPGQFLVVWLDGQPEQTSAGNLHASFRLGAGPGSVALVTPLLGGTNVFDYLNYTNLAPGTSYGDYPDGQMFYRQAFAYATAGGTNNPAQPLATNVLTINEWMASNTRTLQEPAGLTFEDWFELYNASDSPVDLGGYTLTDNLLQPGQYVIPAGYVVPARGHLMIWADGAPERNHTNSPILHVNFQLSRAGEEIGLFAPNGQLVDSVTFGAQTNDVSQGRYPDGAGLVVFMTNATPGAANQYDAPPNSAPVLGTLSNRVLFAGQTLAFTVTATDAEAPPQTLTFSLEPGLVGNASLTSGGNFSWTPLPNQAPSTNLFTVRVTDDGIPPLSATGTFSVVVGLPPQLDGGNARIVGNQLSLDFRTIPGKTYQAQYKNSLNDAQWTNLGAAQTATGAALTISDNLAAQPARFYRVIVVE